MGLFPFFRQKRAVDSNKRNSNPETFILEPILTPSGIVDGGDDTPDAIVVDLDSNLPEEVDSSASANNSLEVDILNEELEPLDFFSSQEINTSDAEVAVDEATTELTSEITAESDIPEIVETPHNNSTDIADTNWKSPKF